MEVVARRWLALPLHQILFNESDLGQQVVILTVTDEFGFVSTCEAVITVLDVQDAIQAIDDVDINSNCPDDITLVTLPGAPFAEVNWTEPIPTTTCVITNEIPGSISTTETVTGPGSVTTGPTATTCNEFTLAHWGLENCYSNSNTAGSSLDYSEFTAEVVNNNFFLNPRQQTFDEFQASIAVRLVLMAQWECV